MEAHEFAIVANKAADKLYIHALKFTRDEDDAKDLLQDTLVKALRFSHRFDSETNLKSWLFVIMRNTFVNNYHKAKRKQDLMTVEDEISSEQLVLSATANKAASNFALSDINKALSTLSELYRVPFTRYVEGYKYEEIAAELNIPLGTVKTHIFEARRQLKKYLKVYRK
ncbi:sigma-70 family RNA polymerase sigma factor [Pedobacter aquatilis]|uniref:sigma-70 family RNA polymerase sigma factor n=1 Tax=Pedobacter aquatilis TaxID=351343 RepID=UPI00292DE019|nr:sigma-70 family RNA polymerase sigma factor [Pedobacter aquatilis]